MTYITSKKFRVLCQRDFEIFDLSTSSTCLLHKPSPLNMFSNIYRIAQGILSLPHSSANVERIFSIQNLIKTKTRNRLAVNTCNSLIQIRDLLKSSGCECHNFKMPKEMVSTNIPNNASEFEEELLE